MKKQRSRNPRFRVIMEECIRIHEAKSHDYAQDDNPFSNFEYSAHAAGITVDQVFACLIGIKMARLSELTRSGKAPKNESIMDTHYDLTTYAGIWASYRMRLIGKETPNVQA